jgi:hypothetical protein
MRQPRAFWYLPWAGVSAAEWVVSADLLVDMDGFLECDRGVAV